MPLPQTLPKLALVYVMLLTNCVVRAFSFRSMARGRPALQAIAVHLHSHREADYKEQLVGGARYEMSELPDSMIDTTVYVGNLNEFVGDDDLSKLFQSVSFLHSVPACVARKPDMSSMQYGFVAFPTKQEKEAAILRFHNTEFKGKRITVETIRDHPKYGRIRVPERMVAYVIGTSTKVKDGSKNGLRRISRDDVERLSRGQPSKQKGYGSRNVPHRLNEQERAELERAARRGYVTLAGNGNRRTRKGSPLANIHRQWCDARGKPQIMLLKAVGGLPVDKVIVDLSPLRLNALFDGRRQIDSFLIKWKTEILSAVQNAGMELEVTTDLEDEDFDGDADDNDYVMTIDEATQEAWATKPIWKLPVVSMGTFSGDRSNAKAMAKELALLWEIPEEGKLPGGGPQNRKNAGAHGGGKTKAKSLSDHRKRGGGHRQAW